MGSRRRAVDGERPPPRPRGRIRGQQVYGSGIGSGRRAVPFVGSLVAFVIALLIGGLAIYASARLVVDVDDYGHAVVTALVGAVAWALTAWISLVGPLIALVVWVGVINWRYPGGWSKAAVIGL